MMYFSDVYLFSLYTKKIGQLTFLYLHYCLLRHFSGICSFCGLHYLHIHSLLVVFEKEPICLFI